MYKRPFERALQKFSGEVDWVCKSFSDANLHPTWKHADFAREMMLIRLHDSWARFCREIIVISAYGKAVTVGGMRLNTSLPSIKSRSHVVPVLVALNNGRFPKWFAASDCIRSANQLKIENLATVVNALGASNSPADQLRDIRNFYAHRGRGTAGLACNAYSFVGRRKPDISQLNDFVAGGNTVLESWSMVLVAIATAAVQ
jgi:hypothetical protein